VYVVKAGGNGDTTMALAKRVYNAGTDTYGPIETVSGSEATIDIDSETEFPKCATVLLAEPIGPCDLISPHVVDAGVSSAAYACNVNIAPTL